ncbi:MAG: MetS family NSS transporter small subunit [Cytophagales bacterium]|nr:MetS family NSS transporter small subunit [Cytophagales bacterium]
MSTSALISMVLILGIIMGGFVFFLRIAIKKENQKDT